MDSKYTNICEELGWSVSESDSDGYVTVSQFSPAGEDFSFDVEENGFPENVKSFALAFDTEEHIEDLVIAKRNGLSGVPSVRRIIEDADAINDMLNELWIALEQVDEPKEASGGAEE